MNLVINDPMERSRIVRTLSGMKLLPRAVPPLSPPPLSPLPLSPLPLSPPLRPSSDKHFLVFNRVTCYFEYVDLETSRIYLQHKRIHNKLFSKYIIIDSRDTYQKILQDPKSHFMELDDDLIPTTQRNSSKAFVTVRPKR